MKLSEIDAIDSEIKNIQNQGLIDNKYYTRNVVYKCILTDFI